MSARPRRSALFMPASNPRALAKAPTLGCDVVILDLEDAVAPAAKAAARDAALAAIRSGVGPRELVVRVNAAATPWGADDLAALRDAPPDAVLLPKVGDPAALRGAREMLGPGPALWAMVETCAGVLNLPALAATATEVGLACLVAGPNDLAADMRCRPGATRTPLLPALSQIVTAARAVGLAALDGVINTLDDERAIEAECRQGRDLGFDGKTLIHPAQIAIANRLFAPDAAEVAAAGEIVAAFARPDAAGRGAIQLGGRMVERLHLEQAERLLAFHRAVTGG